MTELKRTSLPNCKYFECVQLVDFEDGTYSVRIYDGFLNEPFGHFERLYYGKNLEMAEFLFDHYSNFYLKFGDVFNE